MGSMASFKEIILDSEGESELSNLEKSERSINKKAPLNASDSKITEQKKKPEKILESDCSEKEEVKSPSSPLTSHKEEDSKQSIIGYDGEIQDGKRHGKGKGTWASNATYDGEWIYDFPYGKGTITFASGSCYKGDFEKGEMQGSGEYIGNDGTFYKGEMLANQFHGYGLETCKNGEKYEGEFRNGKREGKGKLFSPGKIFEGEFLNGMKHGKGKLIQANGVLIEGMWINDELTHQTLQIVSLI